MIADLDQTLQEFLESEARAGSELDNADISFDLPDTEWETKLTDLTVNLYLYRVGENLGLRRHEPLIQRDTGSARRVRPPVRVDCAYCITAWSAAAVDAVFEEHRLLGQVLEVLLQHRTIPTAVLQGAMASQVPPFPTVVATQDLGKSEAEFWGALDQQLKPSLNYVVTLAYFLDDLTITPDPEVSDIDVVVHHMEEAP